MRKMQKSQDSGQPGFASHGVGSAHWLSTKCWAPLCVVSGGVEHQMREMQKKSGLRATCLRPMAFAARTSCLHCSTQLVYFVWVWVSGGWELQMREMQNQGWDSERTQACAFAAPHSAGLLCVCVSIRRRVEAVNARDAKHSRRSGFASNGVCQTASLHSSTQR